MICDLCKGKKLISMKIPQDRLDAMEMMTADARPKPVRCPRCSGEGLLPTIQQIVELVEKGEVCWLDIPTMKYFADARAILRKLSSLRAGNR